MQATLAGPGRKPRVCTRGADGHSPRGDLVSKRALVVDDSATMREMVSYTLKQAGFEPLVGKDGQDGLDRLTGEPVDLIITDLNMPVMDGLAFIKSVRTKEEYKFTPILMLTTESQSDMKAQGKAAGATGWLVKPFNPEMLLQVIAKVVPKT
jgi:two-component system chemotaxis response regulator CheY